MRRGRIDARIVGYVYLEIAGRIEVTKYSEQADGVFRILGFQSIDANFEFEDRTQEGTQEQFSALIISSRVIRTQSGDETHCVLEVF